MQKAMTDMKPMELAAALEVAYRDRGGRSREAVAMRNGFCGRQLKRYRQLNQLIPRLQEQVDQNHIGIAAAVELSYLSETEQAIVAAQPRKITRVRARELHRAAGTLTKKRVREILTCREER